MTDTPKDVSRRSLIGSAGLVAAGAVLAACTDAATNAAETGAPAIIGKPRELKMVTAWPPNFPGLGVAAARLAKTVEEVSGGNIKIKVHAAGELVPALEAFDFVSNGGADMYHAAEYYWRGKSEGFNFFTTVPFGMSANEINAWIYHGGGQALWDELSAKFNLKAMPVANSGPQMGGWYNKEIASVEDLKGLKIRMPGLGGEVLRRLGANVLTLPGGEIFSALQNGTIDAAEWIGPSNDLAFGFAKAAKFYYWPGFHEPGASLALGVNLDVWKDMSPAQQRIIQTCAAADDSITLADFNWQSGVALKQLESEGVQLRRFPDEVLRELGRVSGEVIREAGAQDELTKRIYDSFMAARAQLMKWTAISEEGAMAARRLDFPY